MDFLRNLFGGGGEEANRDRFARLALKALRKANPAFVLQYDREKFELVDDENRRTFLSNTYLEYQRCPPVERAALIDRFVAFVVESRQPRPTGDNALDALLPVLRSRADLVAMHTELGDFPYAKASRPFCDTMLLMLAIDSPNAIALLNDEQLEDLGISFEDALGIATGHLDELGNHSFGQLADGTFVTNCEDTYDASRILIPELITQLPLKGRPVAIVEARSAVLVTGHEDMKGLEMIAKFAWEDYPQNERAISLTPIELADGKWQVLQIEDSHPQPLRNLLHYQRSWSYGATQQPLQALLDADLRVLYVASAMLVENGDMATTVASWGTDVLTACPMVDAVVIGADGEFPELTRRLEDVVKVCGPFERVAEMPYPPRLEFPGKPTPEQRRILTNDYPHHELFPPTSGD